MPYKKTDNDWQARPLTKLQVKYVSDRSKGLGHRNPRLDKLPQVQQAIRDIHQQTQAVMVFDLSKAMAAVQRAVDHAYEQQGGSMAVVKGTELMCKLAGLLIEKHEIITLSIKDALDLAKARALERAPKFIEAQAITVSSDTSNGTSSDNQHA